MSVESGILTYQGKGGIWESYDWEEVACQSAFDRDPKKVLRFHELRRKSISTCKPHPGYEIITRLQQVHPMVTIITQNIDGLHQKSGSINVIELHGSLWRIRCSREDIVYDDYKKDYKSYNCTCGAFMRPDIIWFGDCLNEETIQIARDVCKSCDLFISIGTSGVVSPASSFPQFAKSNGALMVEINPEVTRTSHLFKEKINGTSADVLLDLFPNGIS